jgi:hypothetical protein
MILRRRSKGHVALWVGSLAMCGLSACSSSGGAGFPDGSTGAGGSGGSGGGTSAESGSPGGGFDAYVPPVDGGHTDSGTVAGGSGGQGGASLGGAGGAGGAGGVDGSVDTGQTSETGSADGGGCQGVPIVPDSTGYVAPGSNSVDIHGSWFVYSDCNDLGGKDCAMVTSPTATGAFPNVGGKMCTSGTNSTAANAWGAGIALELNDGPPQMPYDTVTHGVTGFCFDLSGSTIPSSTIRVAFTTTENNDNAPFEAISTPGAHTVLFSDTAQGSWVTTKTTFDPTMVVLVQFQIPASTASAVAWDFCISNMTAVMQ